MGNSQVNQYQVKSKNAVQNSASIYQNSDQDQNQKNSEEAKPFENLDQKHRRIINIAIQSALKKLQFDEQITKAEEQQKKIISSLNRYYQQNKKKCSYVDAENMTQLDYEWIIRTLKRHHLFRELFEMMNTQKDFITQFLLTVRKKTFKFRDYIYKQFDTPQNFYLIVEGKLCVQLNSMGLRPLGRGDYFGLESIIYDSEQGESVKVKSLNAILYEINKNQILKVHQKISKRHKNQIRQLLEEKVIFFNFLDNKQKEHLLSKTVRSTYSKGQIIFQKDYDSNSFFVIKKGYVLIKIPQKKDLILQAGNSFGQSSFYQHKGQRVGKAIAYENNTVIYGIGAKAIFKSLGSKLDCAVLQNLQKWALYRDIYINQLFFTHNFDMEKLLHRFKVKKAQKYDILARKGQTADKIFINVRCEINFTKDLCVFNSQSVKIVFDKYFNQSGMDQTNDMFLETKNSVMNEYNRQKDQIKQIQEYVNELAHQMDIIVTQRGSYAQTTVKQVIQLLAQAIEQPQKHRQQRFKVDLSVRNIKKYAKLKQTETTTTILAVQKNFEIETIVRIYHKNPHSTNQHFLTHTTINTVNSKYQISSKFPFFQSEVQQAFRYKQIIETLNYETICGFYKAEQDEDNVYLILEYIKGVTLYQVHDELGIMPQTVVKFYVLKLSLMLDYLHQNKILFRNLNPEHILVDNKGYPNLFDFNLAKKLTSETNFKTSTLIGSPHYFSPEMIQKKPYSFSTDYWQLGVIMYQLIYEKLPFGNSLEDPMQIFTQILQKQPKLKKQNSKQIFKGLLNKNPSNRVQNFTQLTKNSFFQNYDWQSVQQQKMSPPYLPKNRSRRFQDIEVFIRNQKFQQ